MSEAPLPVAWTPTAKRALTRLPEKAAAAAVEFIYGPVAEIPRRVGKALRRESNDQNLWMALGEVT
ncbi:hypothetical protein H5397_16710 [Propioniciclava sp. MC1683]|uniref:type II toxin-antitoxin system RelE family toxin n=1 Tax=Propioniciclava sp. MC1683 TaxID=2760309 RepID=UPI0016032D70|nr:hypothetical protein [Propioniciclava sp. MC1683]MBB1503038.1 hypothetical protein [Propioniciclava sp. MC1683]